MGQLAGQAMAGRTVTYDHLPFFYSDLFELGYEAVGEVDSRLETVADWKAPSCSPASCSPRLAPLITTSRNNNRARVNMDLRPACCRS
jgi:hypothetical protein